MLMRNLVQHALITWPRYRKLYPLQGPVTQNSMPVASSIDTDLQQTTTILQRGKGACETS